MFSFFGRRTFAFHLALPSKGRLRQVVISTKVKVASTPKHLKELVVRSYFKKPKETCRSATNAIIGYKEGIRAQNSPPPSVSTTFNLALNCISLDVAGKS